MEGWMCSCMECKLFPASAHVVRTVLPSRIAAFQLPEHGKGLSQICMDRRATGATSCASAVSLRRPGRRGTARSPGTGTACRRSGTLQLSSTGG